jgi:hypothetical protein
MTTTTVLGGKYGLGAYCGTGCSVLTTDIRLADNILYSAKLGTNQLALINQYESAKWGVALTGPGVIGAQAGLTGTEAQQAMASVQAGATTDGFSVFSTGYLNRLSQTSNVILQASNNINLDLKGDTLSLAAGKNLTLTAGNQILNLSAGTITTAQSSGAGGGITFNAANGILVNAALALNSGGGTISLKAAMAREAVAVIEAAIQRVTAERDEAREVVARCNNSFGSYSYHLDPHPAEQIEQVKWQARSEWQRAEAATAEAASLRAENEKIKAENRDIRTELDALIQEVMRNG